MRKEIKEISVKDLVNEINTSVEEGDVISSKKRKSPTSSVTFTVIASSGCDFILNKKTTRTSRTLVSLPGSGLLYIYDENTDTKEPIIDCKQITRFFQGKKSDDYILEPGVLAYARHGIKKDEVPKWYELILNNKAPGVMFLLKRSLLDFSQVSRSYRYYDPFRDIEACYALNPNLLLYIFKNMTFDSISNYNTIIVLACAFYKVSGLDVAKYFVDKMMITSVRFNYIKEDELQRVIKEYNLDVKRVIDYLLFDMYKQGFQYVNPGNYIDYLDQSYAYYGKIKEKYPKNLMTDHHIISMKVRQKAALATSSAKFAEIMSETEDFTYQNTVDKYKILMPEDSMDLVEEGSYLCHCVASYVDKVNAGDCIVVFMREKDAEDVPYLTVEILPDRSVPQIEGMNKRRDLTEDEIIFIHHWAKFKHLKITADNAKEDPTKSKKKKMKEIA